MDGYNHICAPARTHTSPHTRTGTKAGGGHENFFEDDNPFNDPFQYRPFKGLAFPPSDYIGPDDRRETDDLSELRPNALRLAFVYGYCGRANRESRYKSRRLR